jgi:hypothetical protein
MERALAVMLTMVSEAPDGMNKRDFVFITLTFVRSMNLKLRAPSDMHGVKRGEYNRDSLMQNPFVMPHVLFARAHGH